MSQRRTRDLPTVSGAWTYAARGELRRRGFWWNGRAWVAPSSEAAKQARHDLSGAVDTSWSLTVHGDAGWKDGVGKWAWFVRWNGGRVEGADAGTCPSVACAEALSLLAGVRVGVTRYQPKDGGVVYLRNDNLGVVTMLQQGARGKLQPVDDLLDLCDRHRLRVDARHVKGHQNPSNSVAAWVNNRVDALSHLRGAGPDALRRLAKETP